MRLEGEAVAVCPSVSGVEWSAGLKRGGLGHFCVHPAAERSRDKQHDQHHYHHHPQHYDHHQHSGLDWQRARRGQESRSRIDHDGDGECEEDGSLRDIREEGPPFCRDLLHSPTIIMASPSKFTVGYALTTKKTQSFLKPTLEDKARSKGIAFTMIDRNRPLDGQGPFDVILHKISAEAWHQQLKAYKQSNPGVIILDPPEAIKKVYNRQSMLQEVAALNFHHPQGKVEIPKQLVVNGEPASISGKVAKEGLKFPLVAKPLWIDGTEKSHALSLAFNEVCLSELTPPLVLQEFVNHGGVLFKVYIVGHIVKVVRRFSLPDVRKDEPGKSGVIPFPRVSCAAASADGADLDPNVGELPPREMLESLCRDLRCKLGLSLFNLDMIREGGKGNCYYIIDINYFPGYGKLPEYEKVFTDFLSSLAEKKCE